MLTVSTLKIIFVSFSTVSFHSQTYKANPNVTFKARNKNSCSTVTTVTYAVPTAILLHHFCVVAEPTSFNVLSVPPGLLFDIYLHKISFFIFWISS